MSTHDLDDDRARDERGHAPLAGSRVRGAIALATFAVLAAGAVLWLRAEARVNHAALAATPKGVTVIEPRATTFRRSRRYVGTVAPWLAASVGPQLVSAYVDTVLVRPGDRVKRGDVVATLDCRNASAASRAVAMQARALEARRAAAVHEASRVAGLLDGGFVSPNEAELKAAESAREEAEAMAERERLAGRALEVGDCVLRAPFDGEVADRMVDPGAFARPGAPIVALVDRSRVRVTLDAPETDFDAVAPSTPVRLRLLATGTDLEAVIARRAPAADASTRTVRVEIDLAAGDRPLPVGTTAEVKLDVGDARPALELPLAAATIRGARARLFVVRDAVADEVTVDVLGESGGSLFVAPTLPSGAAVVIEGRALLAKGDRVAARTEAERAPATAPSTTPAAASRRTGP